MPPRWHWTWIVIGCVLPMCLASFVCFTVFRVIGMTIHWLVIAAIYAGLLLATCIVGTVIYDLIALRNGWRTVSGDTMRLANRFVWVAVIVAGTLAFAVGVLVGHLFFPQIIQP
jgi:hypothetical protein